LDQNHERKLCQVRHHKTITWDLEPVSQIYLNKHANISATPRTG